jgi:menaquinone-specific isochorismate synthase
MKARTLPIADPGDLVGLLPSHAVTWIRNLDGMIGIGSAAACDRSDAQEWWSGFTAELDHHQDAGSAGGSPAFGEGPLAFVSLPFDPGNTAARPSLLVPQAIIGRRKGRSWITLVGEGRELDQVRSVEDVYGWLGIPDPRREHAPRAPQVTESTPVGLDGPAWRDAVGEAVARIGDDLSKVVLARAVRLRTAADIDVRWLLGRLAEQYPTCWTYHNNGLVGASPEMLVRREHGLVTSRVLAGTIRRDGSEELDLKLAHALARSSKNLAEHELAVDSVAAALAPFASGMNVPERPFVLELPNVLHLASDVTAVVHQQVSALQVAAALHPSAAVCGTPTDLARATIAELEKLDRGRYSGPVGWIDADGDGEFAIALRCGQIDAADPTTITIYAGCGIVAESDPDEEYAETTAKLLPMREALGVSAK